MTASAALTPRIAGELFNRPLLLLPETAIAIASNLAARFDVDVMDAAADAAVVEASRFRGRPAGRGDDGRDMYRAEKGIAIIAVMGELVNRGAWIGASSGLTSYEGLDAQLRQAAADPNIRGLLLDLNSPGGEATGAMETGALVRAIAAEKPVVALVNGMAASAAYAIASGATHIVTSASGLVGSIGVVMLHLDRSAALAKAGVKPTLIYAGKHKVDGSSLAELPDDARGRLQGAVDDMYGLFVKTVADHRKLSQKAVRATEGGVLMGQAAVDAGLADAIGGFDDAMAFFDPKPRTARNAAVSPSAPTAITPVPNTAAIVAQAAAAATERARAIVTAAEAQGRPRFALYLATHTDIPVAEALGMLALAALEIEPSPSSNHRAEQRPAAKEPPQAPDSWAGVVDDFNRRHGLAVPQGASAAGVGLTDMKTRQ